MASVLRLAPYAVGGGLLLGAVALGAQAPAGAGGDDDLRAALIHAAERTLLPARCGECHAAEFEVWAASGHATGFDTLHRGERAKEIYRRLDLRLIKRATEETTPACLSCHYTPILRRDRLRAGAGVSCESCHGPARDWIEIHNDYGVAESDFQQAALIETDEHRRRRTADSRAAGMRRPSDLVDVAANCFGCHTVPNEELVNRAGHSTGSDFELVTWSERIRHNFLESYKTADGRTNAERPAAWKRVMYVVGRALDLEYAVRGMAAATAQDLYFLAMSDRADGALDELFEINERVAIPAVETIVARWGSAVPAVGAADALNEVADAIRQATRQFVAGADGAALAALDPLWDPMWDPTAAASEAPVRLAEVPREPDPPPSALENAVPAVAAAEPVAVAASPAGVPAPRPAPPPPPAPPATATVAPTAPSAPTAPQAAAAARLETLTRPPWREPPAHDFVKVPCGRCHNSQERWWRTDAHAGTARPFRRQEPRYQEIAEAYGVAGADMARGNQICMWCHGTPVSAPTRNVRAGVGCQRCHGAGADYLEPHETVGYAAAVGLGLTDLRDPAIQAATCAGCHYITEPRLIGAGHPTGAGFDPGASLAAIVHWGAAFGRETAPVGPEALGAAYATVLERRGSPPVAASRPAAPPVAAAPPAGRAAPVAAPVSRGSPVAAAPAPRRPEPRERAAVRGARPPRSAASAPPRRQTGPPPALVDDPGLDDLNPDEDAPVEALLDLLRERIEQLYRALGRPE